MAGKSATPTVSDVAARAGVSFATAARALGGYGYVGAKSREKVDAAARELGYRQNDVARALASGSTRTVGLVVGDIENPFFATASRGLANALEQEGYTLLLANSDEDAEREARSIEALRSRVDGLVVAPAVSSGAQALKRPDKPLVVFDRTVRGLDVDCVSVDNAAAAGLAVRHLIELGHRRIGVVCAPSTISSTSARLRGYRAELKRAGIAHDDTLVERGPFTRADAHAAALRLLDRPDRPDAVFATENYMTEGVLRAARDLGLRIPDDVALVGFDDAEWMPLVDPPVTAVAQPVFEIGQEAGRLLLARLAGDDAPPRKIRLHATLVVRESCGATRATDRA